MLSNYARIILSLSVWFLIASPYQVSEISPSIYAVDAAGIRYCGRGKLFNSCAVPKSCEITCNNISNPPQECPDICVPRCACPPERPYVKNFNGHEFCVKKCNNDEEEKTTSPSLTPSNAGTGTPSITIVEEKTSAPTLPTDPRCNIKGMRWNECASPCPPTCSDPNPETCIAECIEQCECPPGYYINDRKNPPECTKTC